MAAGSTHLDGRPKLRNSPVTGLIGHDPGPGLERGARPGTDALVDPDPGLAAGICRGGRRPLGLYRHYASVTTQRDLQRGAGGGEWGRAYCSVGMGGSGGWGEQPPECCAVVMTWDG